MPKVPQYSYDDVRKAVTSSISIREVIIKLNLIPAGGNYNTVKKLIEKLQLNTSHFLGQSSNKGRNFGPKRPIEDYLTNKYPIQSYRFKNRLIQEGYFDYRCSKCNNETWLDQSIPLELHHKDGNKNNNNLDNLTILCPNCHALTSTYRGRNIQNT